MHLGFGFPIPFSGDFPNLARLRLLECWQVTSHPWWNLLVIIMPVHDFPERPHRIKKPLTGGLRSKELDVL